MSNYYNVRIFKERLIVKAKGTTAVRKFIMDRLKDSYSYSRATTDDVVEYLGDDEIEDLDSPVIEE